MSEPLSEKTGFHWPTLVQLILSGIAVLLAWGFAALMFFAGGLGLLGPGDDPFLIPTALSLGYASLLAGGLFAVPVVYAALRLAGGSPQPGTWWRKLRAWCHPRLILLAYPLVLIVGYLSARTDSIRSVVLPLANIMALGLPVLLLLWLALRGLPKGSPQLGWGAFTLGMAVGPTVILFLELIVLVLIFFGIGVAAEADPELMEMISRFSLLGFEVDDPALFDQTIGELLNTPQVLAAILALLAGFVPIIEELFKPVAVWVIMLRRRLQPVDGWVIGALSGAGFALFENFGNASISQNWVIDVLIRAAATIPHVFTAAFLGYTLALARTTKKYGQAVLAFAGMVAIHGAWNGAYVLNLAASAAPPGGALNPTTAPVFLGIVAVLAGGMLIALLRINRSLRRRAAPQMLPEDLPQPDQWPVSKENQTDGSDYRTD